MLSHITLVDLYRLHFSLMEHHRYNLTELEAMIPWEREIYSALLLEWLAAKEEAQKNG